MPRDHKAGENRKRAAAMRSNALARVELGQPTVPRESAAGPTSMAVKTEDPATRALIDAALASRQKPVEE